MKVGVTGTRFGLNDRQKENAYHFLLDLKNKGFFELHHGDCDGVDVQLAKIAKDLGFKIVCHPPKDNDRVFFPSDENREPLGHFARNRNIVNETNFLIVVPKEDSHQTHGGVWYTYDYAIKTKKETIIFYPNI